MDYHITFDNGSSAYLAHHGVLGMKWGVRNAETRAKYASEGHVSKKRQAKAYQKTLNDYDRRMQYASILAGNAKYTSEHYGAKAKKAEGKGNIKKMTKNAARADTASKQYRALMDDYESTGKKYVDTVKKMSSEGYSYKISQVNYSSPTTIKNVKAVNGIIEKYGRVPYMTQYNVSAGNKWKVRESTSKTQKRDKRWSNKHKMQTPHPQTMYYVYV